MLLGIYALFYIANIRTSPFTGHYSQYENAGKLNFNVKKDMLFQQLHNHLYLFLFNLETCRAMQALPSCSLPCTTCFPVAPAIPPGPRLTKRGAHLPGLRTHREPSNKAKKHSFTPLFSWDFNQGAPISLLKRISRKQAA